MKKRPTIATIILAAGTLLPAHASAQQTPAPSPQQAPAPKAQKPAAPKPRPAPAAKKPSVLTLKTDKDKASYAIGMNIGTGLHKESADVDPAIVAQGLKDAFADGKTLLTEEEARAALTQFQNDLRKAQVEKMQKLGEENKKAGETFLAENKTKEGVVALPSGLQYKVLTEGTARSPQPRTPSSATTAARSSTTPNLTAPTSAASPSRSPLPASSKAGRKRFSSCLSAPSGNFLFRPSLLTAIAAALPLGPTRPSSSRSSCSLSSPNRPTSPRLPTRPSPRNHLNPLSHPSQRISPNPRTSPAKTNSPENVVKACSAGLP